MSLGPVPLPVALAISFLLLALLVARLWPRPPGVAWRPATALLVDMFLLGLLAARVLFVLRAAPLYLADPGSILRIGESLSLKVVAEGVENAAQRAVLASLKCDLLQGYYVSRPLSPHSLERWISLQPPPAA